MLRARIGLLAVLLVVGCGYSQRQVLVADPSQARLRSIQTRAFDTTDKEHVLRAVVATLQDLGFIIDVADAELGTVSGTKWKGYVMRLTVSVRPRGKTQMLVRANGQFGLNPIEDPEPYQDFFTALAKELFLTAHDVPEGAPGAASGAGSP